MPRLEPVIKMVSVMEFFFRLSLTGYLKNYFSDGLLQVLRQRPLIIESVPSMIAPIEPEPRRHTYCLYSRCHTYKK